MGFFNWPPDPEPPKLTYYRDRRKKAYQIDPGVRIAMNAPKTDPSKDFPMKWFFILVAIILVIVFFATVAYSAPLPNAATTREVQTILASHGYSVQVDGVYGPQTQRAVKHWQKANHLVVDGIVGQQTLQSLERSVDGPLKPATRLNPPRQPGLNGLPIAPAGLSGCEEMNYYREQFGLPQRFDDSGHHQTWTRSDGIGWRESKCNNSAHNACCGGYWQNYVSSHLSKGSQYRIRIIEECQVNRLADILGEDPIAKQKSACVTKVVYDISGLKPWA